MRGVGPVCAEVDGVRVRLLSSLACFGVLWFALVTRVPWYLQGMYVLWFFLSLSLFR